MSASQIEVGFVGEKLSQTVSELEAVRAKLKEKADQLAEAENILKFYGDPRSYQPTRILEGKTVYQDRLKDDSSTSDNDADTNIAGRRAREYFKKYE